MTAVDFDGMRWGWKLVAVDLTTDDHNGGRHRYRLGQLHEATDPTEHNNPCPQHPGDGLCVAKTFTGAASGGQRIGASTMLLVHFRRSDVLAEDANKIRVRRLWVHPDPLDPVRIIATPNADLHGADLREADLRGANLHGADLHGADLRWANLRGAVADRDTMWPDEFDPTAAGVVER